jgi:hypothetical protein
MGDYLEIGCGNKLMTAVEQDQRRNELGRGGGG